MNFIKIINEYRLIIILLLFIIPNNIKSQVSIKESNKDLKTYDFSDPNPIPIFVSNPKIYPYFTFDGYNIESKLKKFNVIELENDYIKVLVTPELGGKVLGAIDKTSGEEFIYKKLDEYGFDLKGVQIIDPKSKFEKEKRKIFSSKYWKIRNRNGVTMSEAKRRIRDRRRMKKKNLAQNT